MTSNMGPLLKNAVSALQVGVEDFGMDTEARAYSAARNFYAGALLLAKEVLVRHAPNADPDLILSAKFNVVSDGKGGASFVPSDRKTIDFHSISQRFKAFGVPFDDVDLGVLAQLGRIRNAIEHKYTEHPHDVVRQAIAKAFPAVLKLFQLIGEDPAQLLTEAWQAMIQIRDVYEMELAACLKTYENVDFPYGELSGEPFCCPACDSEMMVQTDPDNTSHEEVTSVCRACGKEWGAEKSTEAAIAHKYGADIYAAVKDGADDPVGTCPECSQDTYVQGVGCIWCQEQLGTCARCEAELTPANCAWDNHNLCDYCDHVMSKDD